MFNKLNYTYKEISIHIQNINFILHINYKIRIVCVFYVSCNFRFVFYAMRFSYVRAITNKLIRKLIDKALNFNEEEKAEIHEKSKKMLPDFSLIY